MEPLSVRIRIFNVSFRAMSKSTYLPSYGWLIVGISVSTLFGLVISDRSFFPAFADGLMVSGASLLAIAWLMHLRGDGLRLLPRRASKEMIPVPGNPPPLPAPLPGEDGPESEAYSRLMEAERRLRERIAGEDKGEDKNARSQAKGSARGIAVSGVVLFLLALLFQYLVPALSAS